MNLHAHRASDDHPEGDLRYGRVKFEVGAIRILSPWETEEMLNLHLIVQFLESDIDFKLHRPESSVEF